MSGIKKTFSSIPKNMQKARVNITKKLGKITTSLKEKFCISVAQPARTPQRKPIETTPGKAKPKPLQRLSLKVLKQRTPTQTTILPSKFKETLSNIPNVEPRDSTTQDSNTREEILNIESYLETLEQNIWPTLRPQEQQKSTPEQKTPPPKSNDPEGIRKQTSAELEDLFKTLEEGMFESYKDKLPK